jgi:hypothetical protein
MLVNVALPVCGVVTLSYDTRNQRGGDHGADWLRTFEGVEPMGRGRAKAKQVKVARQLKYNKSDDTDLDRLRSELGVGADSGDGHSATGDFDDDDEDDEDDDESPGSQQGAWDDADDDWSR